MNVSLFDTINVFPVSPVDDSPGINGAEVPAQEQETVAPESAGDHSPDNHLDVCPNKVWDNHNSSRFVHI
jgi:hypothetical protein